MRIFQPSTLFRDDIAFGRYCAHSLTALSHLALAGALYAYLAMRPAPDVSPWVWVAALVCPGAWLFTAGMSYVMMVIIRQVGGTKALVFLGDESQWRSILFRREALAAIAFFALIPATISWYGARPFGDEEFHRCVTQLREPGLRALSETVRTLASRDEFWTACWKARNADVAGSPLPATTAELRARYAR